jgi:hypothetical protein
VTAPLLRVRRDPRPPSPTRLLLTAAQVGEVNQDIRAGLDNRRRVSTALVYRLQANAHLNGVVFNSREVNRLTTKVMDLLEEQHPLVPAMLDRGHTTLACPQVNGHQ